MMTNTKILIVLLLLVLAALVAVTVYAIGAIVGILLVAVLFAFIVTPFVNALEGSGWNRTIASVLMFLFALGVLGVALYFISPIVYAQVADLQNRISIGELRGGLRDVEHWLSAWSTYFGAGDVALLPKMEGLVNTLVSNILDIASGLVGAVLFGVMTLISTFFLIKDGRRLKKSMIEIVPNQFFEMAMSILHKIDWSLGAYIRGILLDALVIGLLTTGAMWLLDIPNFVLIGVVAAMANMVPYLGPPTAALVASSISLISTSSFEQIPTIIVAFIIIRLLDDSIVQPLTISQTVRLHPLTIIFVILIGGQLFGILGMLFAVPVAGVVKVIASELYFGLKRYRAVY
jgi:predicted PurR-regulated permease PerM